MEKIAKNNKGFSLIELIVAVIILGVLSAGAVAGFSSVVNARVDSATDRVVNVLKQARTTALGMLNHTDSDNKTQIYARIYLENGNYYISICRDTDVLLNEKICNDNISLVFQEHKIRADGTFTETDIVTVGDGNTDNDIVKLYFKKGTGEISKVVAANYDDSDEDEKMGINQIKVQGVKDSKNVILVAVTGRCYAGE